jgi:hypothetical protein
MGNNNLKIEKQNMACASSLANLLLTISVERLFVDPSSEIQDRINKLNIILMGG